MPFYVNYYISNKYIKINYYNYTLECSNTIHKMFDNGQFKNIFYLYRIII